jgi:hypothetical protein
MTTSLPSITEIIPIVLQLPSAIAMNDDQFYEFCQLNHDFNIERNAIGELVIMPQLLRKLINVTLTVSCYV